MVLRRKVVDFLLPLSGEGTEQVDEEGLRKGQSYED